jgi:hypothetical protein
MSSMRGALEIPKSFFSVASSLSFLSSFLAILGKFRTKQEIDDYFSDPEGIQCLLCGRLLGTLNGHLQIVHRTNHEEYRKRFGLPWRRGLVSASVSNHLSNRLTDRIRKGTFLPKPDNKAAVAGIRARRRNDQPFVTAEKAEKAKEQSKSNQRYRHKDFENVLAAMLRRKATLQEVCMTKNLPSKGTVLHYAESNPDFRKKMLETYHALPYAVQARANMFSPKFFEELKDLRDRGFNPAEIARQLKVSRKTIVKHLKRIINALA